MSGLLARVSACAPELTFWERRLRFWLSILLERPTHRDDTNVGVGLRCLFKERQEGKSEL